VIVRSERITIQTRGRGTTEITAHLDRAVGTTQLVEGLATVFLHHTSASLILCENADPTVRTDLEAYFARLVPDGDPEFVHDAEGPDDMPAHIRSILTQNTLTIPIRDGRCDLGTWQGVFLWEHRTQPHRRQLTITVLGNKLESSRRS
jgi:secondary thiamine-phosphate synthase enzyme